MNDFAYSIVLPTYKRPDMLQACLQSVCDLDYPKERFEIIVVDNGGPSQNTESIARPFANALNLRYLVNEQNRGYGYCTNRGMRAASGRRTMFLNDDVRPVADVLRLADELFERDPLIGCIGCRAIEEGYVNHGEGIGRMDPSGEVIANFNVDCGQPLEVEHVYGFCYVFTREAVNRAGAYDEILLAKSYSSGDRIETDHCLSIREGGLKVVYHPGMIAHHFPKPRVDMSEISLRWKLNSIRNTIYLFLKHYGLFGRGGAALRLTFLVDVGLLSMLRRPTRANVAYFLNGLRARTSAYAHYLRHLLSRGTRIGPTRTNGAMATDGLKTVRYAK